MKINIKNKTKGWILFSTLTIITAIAVWVLGKVFFADGQWLYNHTRLICLLLGVAFVLVVIDCALFWNNTPTVTLAATAIIVATTVTAKAGDRDRDRSGTTIGLTNPYGGVPAPNPYGWLLRGWNFFNFVNIFDSVESWSTGAPKITIDPNPPSNNDTSGK